jgi:hypothetical protein
MGDEPVTVFGLDLIVLENVKVGPCLAGRRGK